MQSKYPEAEKFHAQAQEIYIRIDNNHGRAKALQGLGEVSLAQSKYREAKRYYLEAEALYIRFGDDHG